MPTPTTAKTIRSKDTTKKPTHGEELSELPFKENYPIAGTSVRLYDELQFDTRIGTLSFTHDFANGYPTTETVEKLYDERDFQRATQIYLWALKIAFVVELLDGFCRRITV